MKVLQGLTKSQVITLSPILKNLKQQLTTLKNEGNAFTLGELMKEEVKDHAWLPTHISIKLLLNKDNVNYKILDARITSRGKLITNPDNRTSVFTTLEDLKLFIN